MFVRDWEDVPGSLLQVGLALAVGALCKICLQINESLKKLFRNSMKLLQILITSFHMFFFFFLAQRYEGSLPGQPVKGKNVY